MSDTDKPTAAGQTGQPDAPGHAVPDGGPANAGPVNSSAVNAGPANAVPGSGSPAGAAGGHEGAFALEMRVKELESQQADLTDRLLRAHAEMDNLRKRTEREKSDSAKYAISKFALDIVGISDNFQRAVASVPAGASEQDATLKSLVEGLQMTERAFLQVLERHGVRRVDPQGEPFDPNRHQAVMEQDNAEVAAGTVLKVFQPGYIIEDRVLRPAMVVVARGGFKPVKPAGPAAASPQGANDNGSGGGGN